MVTEKNSGAISPFSYRRGQGWKFEIIISMNSRNKARVMMVHSGDSWLGLVRFLGPMSIGPKGGGGT
jgi:hypothetical protein